MATTQRPRTPRRTAPSAGPDPAGRGLLLVLVAVLLGLLLLWKGGAVGFDDDGESVDIGEGGTEQTDDTPAEDTTTTTAAPPPTIAPNEVKVVAANGAGVSGLAGRATEFLATQGYSNSLATDAAASAATTQVYFAAGFEGNAIAVAQFFGVAPDSVQSLPAGTTLASNQPSDAGVVVVLGPDAATAIDAAEGTATTATTGASGTSGTSGSGASVTTTTTG